MSKKYKRFTGNESISVASIQDECKKLFEAVKSAGFLLKQDSARNSNLLKKFPDLEQIFAVENMLKAGIKAQDPAELYNQVMLTLKEIGDELPSREEAKAMGVSASIEAMRNLCPTYKPALYRKISVAENITWFLTLPVIFQAIVFGALYMGYAFAITLMPANIYVLLGLGAFCYSMFISGEKHFQ